MRTDLRMSKGRIVAQAAHAAVSAAEECRKLRPDISGILRHELDDIDY